jgi:hypothetical protein
MGIYNMWPFFILTLQKEIGSNVTSIQYIPMFVTNSTLPFTSWVLAQATIPICFLLQFHLSSLSQLQFIIYVVLEWPFKTINLDNKLHERKGLTMMNSSMSISSTHVSVPGTKQDFSEYCWMSEWRNKTPTIACPSVVPHIINII